MVSKLEPFANHRTISAFENTQLKVASALMDIFNGEGGSSTIIGVPACGRVC